MKNLINLRPHHFLCLPGYKGYAYSTEHASSWDRMANILKNKHDVKVKIVSGRDTLCKTCPNNGSNGATCNERLLNKLDEAVKNILDLKDGMIYKYEEILEKLRSKLNEKSHEGLCGSCHWRAKGLCKDTFKKSQI